MRPRLEKLLEGKEELLYKLGMLLRPTPEGKPLKFQPSQRFAWYIKFITWYLNRYPNLMPGIIQNSTRGSLDTTSRFSKVEIRTDPETGVRILHEEGEFLIDRNCEHSDFTKDWPVILSERDGKQPAKVIYS